jgi:cation/acetate symporter
MLIFYLCILLVGFGAAALVGPRTILSAPGAENSAAPLLALRIGGPVLFGIVSGVAFATILAVVAGLTIASSSSFAHDVYANVIKRGHADAASEIRVARTTAIVVGALAIVAGILATGQNVAFLVSLALALAASANLSPLVYSLYWKRFNTAGSLSSIYGGLLCCLTLIVFSPVLSGTPSSLFPGVDFHWFPLTNPGIVSIPFSFLCGFIGTLVSGERASREKQAEMEIRAFLGADVVRK